jgi:ribosomal 50S subunit-recycling heat shock protein
MAKQVAKQNGAAAPGDSKLRKKDKATRVSAAEEILAPAASELPIVPDANAAGEPVHQTIEVSADGAGQRLDQFLAAHLDGVSRSRVQMLMDQGDVLVNGEREKPSLKLRGGEHILITGEPRPTPLKATAEDIPLDVVYEDADLAVINKPAGMMVHAGSGQNEDERSKGTLVNALLYRFKKLSSTGGDLRPGHCASAGQGHQRADRRGQERPCPCGAGGDVFQPPNQEDLCRAGAGLVERDLAAPSTPPWAATRCGARA